MSLRRHVPAGNLAPPWPPQYSKPSYAYEDRAKSGRPLDATDEEMCKKVRDLVYSCRGI